MTNSNNIKHIIIKGEKEKVYVTDLTPTTKGRIVNKTKLDKITDDYQVSFVSNYMFMTVLNNEQYKFLACKVLSEFTNFDFEELMENANFYKNELNKDSVDSKGERGDLIIKMKDKFFVVEMDMKNEIFRNIGYSDRVYRIEDLSGNKVVIYPEICYIGFENFSFDELNKDIMVFHVQTDEGICLLPRQYVLVFLPKMLKTWYDKDINKEHEGIYKTILTMYETSREKAQKIAKGDEYMEDYLRITKEVQDQDYGLWRAYDHEQSTLESYEWQAREEAEEYKKQIKEQMEKQMEKQMEEKSKQMEEKLEEKVQEKLEEKVQEKLEEKVQENRLEYAKALINSGVDKQVIIENLKLTEDEIKKLD